MSRRSQLRAKARALVDQRNGDSTRTQNVLNEPRWKEPPGDGRRVIEHIDTFVAKAASFANTHLNPDEAYQQNKTLQRAMLLDPVCMEPMLSRILSVALLDWSVKPEDEEDEYQKGVCGRLERSVRRIPYFTKFRFALLWAVWFGRYGTQVAWSLGWDNKTGKPSLNVKRRPMWNPVHGDKFRIKFQDDDEGQEGDLGVFVRGGSGSARTPLGFSDEARVHWLKAKERECFVFHQHEILDGDFFDPKSSGSIMGLGLRHRVWWPWFFKQNLSGWIHDFAQRVGTGTTIWYYDQDNKESENAVRTAAERSNNQNHILFPRGPDHKTRGAGIERVEASTGGAQFLQSLLQDGWERQIKLMIAGQTLTSETGATGLGSNVADKHADTKSQYQLFDAQNLDETLTEDLLGPMLNYPRKWSENWRPRFESSVTQPDPQKLMQAARQFFDMGGKVSEDELRDTAGLRKPRQGENVLSKQKAEPQGGGMMGGEEQPDGGPADDHAWIDSLFGGEGQEAA